MNFSASEVGLFSIAFFVFGTAFGFGWSDSLWSQHRQKAVEPQHALDGITLAGTQQLVGVHDASLCAGRPCVIHNPSEHHMRGWPLVWRDDVRVMERTCAHGVGHPDPDHLESVRVRFGKDAAETQSIHGCDGCCSSTNAWAGR